MFAFSQSAADLHYTLLVCPSSTLLPNSKSRGVNLPLMPWDEANSWVHQTLLRLHSGPRGLRTMNTSDSPYH